MCDYACFEFSADTHKLPAAFSTTCISTTNLQLDRF